MRLLLAAILPLFCFGQGMQPRDNVACVMDSYVGVREATGKNDGLEVENFLSYVKMGKGNPWCAAFVCYVLGESCINNPRSAWSPALFPKKNVIYQKNDKTKNATPNVGDVFGIYFTNLKRVAHVGFVREWSDGNYYVTVEGNTNQAGSREGDGVYRKRRLKSQVYQISDFISR